MCEGKIIGVFMVINNNPNLDVNFSHLESFRSKRENVTTSIPPVENNTDKVEISKEPVVESTPPKNTEPEVKPKKKKRSFIQGIKNCIAGVKKFGVATAEYTVATAKGLYYGIIAAGAVLGIDAAAGAVKMVKDGVKNTAPEVSEKGGNIIANGAKKINKFLSKTGKFGALATGLAVLGYNWFKASLNVSERSAAIDHRWGSGHDEVNR